VARRLSATIRSLWPQDLALIPDGPYQPFNPFRFRTTLAAFRQYLQQQLERELLALGAWAGETSARAMRGAYARSESTVREMADEFRPPDDTFGGGGGGFVPSGFSPSGEPIFTPPSAFEITRIVGPAPLRLTKLFDVDRTAAVVWQGIADGKDRRWIAKELAKVLDGDMVAARRTARTEGLRVATQVHLQTAEQIPDLVIGYQIHATLDSRTRPEHAARHGEIYYRNPGPGQKGFNEMPQPPIDPGGVLAYNCRCFLAPVFDGVPTLIPAPIPQKKLAAAAAA
jgi:SPP1 gp7 family putative phage head morphogenesis protein